jgi:hypothetical protein
VKPAANSGGKNRKYLKGSINEIKMNSKNKKFETFRQAKMNLRRAVNLKLT